MLYDVLGEHIYYITHRCMYLQGKSLKAQAIYINLAKQDQG